MSNLLQHFQFKPLYVDERIPGWNISFYYSGKKYEAIYHPNGTIEWQSESPIEIEKLQKQIHDLMLFHVYDAQR